MMITRALKLPKRYPVRLLSIPSESQGLKEHHLQSLETKMDRTNTNIDGLRQLLERIEQRELLLEERKRITLERDNKIKGVAVFTLGAMIVVGALFNH
jgi:hypothetical protein